MLQIANGIAYSPQHSITSVTHAVAWLGLDTVRTLQRGTALSERTLQDAVTRAFDKGKQLSRSVRITETIISQASVPAPIAITLPPTVNPEVPNGQPGSQTAPPIQTRPLETLQQFQTSLLAAKDLNNLLSVLVNTLHDNCGFTRVPLVLLKPGDTDQLLGRVVVGVDSPGRYLASFTGSLNAEHPLFLHVLKGQDPFLLSKVSIDGPRSLSSTFLTAWRTSSAILAPSASASGRSDSSTATVDPTQVRCRPKVCKRSSCSWAKRFSASTGCLACFDRYVG